MKAKHALGIIFIMGLVISIGYGFEENSPVLNEDMLKFFSYRAIGPARQGGRIVDIAVPPEQKNRFYVASASGGLWKAENGGKIRPAVWEEIREKGHSRRICSCHGVSGKET